MENMKKRGDKEGWGVIFCWSFEMKKLYYHEKEYPFASKNHYHMYIFDNTYPNYDKTWNPPITFSGEAYFKKFWELSILISYFLEQNNPIYWNTLKSKSGWYIPPPGGMSLIFFSTNSTDLRSFGTGIRRPILFSF